MAWVAQSLQAMQWVRTVVGGRRPWNCGKVAKPPSCSVKKVFSDVAFQFSQLVLTWTPISNPWSW